MTTKAERRAHNEAGLRHPNAEWCEDYAKWYRAYARSFAEASHE